MNAPGPLYVTYVLHQEKTSGFWILFFGVLWYGENLISESKFNKWKNIASQYVISMYSGLSKESLFDLENSKNKSGSNILVEFSYDLYLLYMVYLSLYLKGFLCYDLHNKCMTLRFKINQSKSYWTFFTYINLFPMVPVFNVCLNPNNCKTSI